MEPSGVLATLSRWRPRVQIPPGTLLKLRTWRGTQIGKAATTTLRVVPETLVNCRFDSDLRHSNNMRRLGIGKLKWL